MRIRWRPRPPPSHLRRRILGRRRPYRRSRRPGTTGPTRARMSRTARPQDRPPGRPVEADRTRPVARGALDAVPGLLRNWYRRRSSWPRSRSRRRSPPRGGAGILASRGILRLPRRRSCCRSRLRGACPRSCRRVWRFSSWELFAGRSRAAPKGKNKLSQVRPIPEKSAETVREDVQRATQADELKSDLERPARGARRRPRGRRRPGESEPGHGTPRGRRPTTIGRIRDKVMGRADTAHSGMTDAASTATEKTGEATLPSRTDCPPPRRPSPRQPRQPLAAGVIAFGAGLLAASSCRPPSRSSRRRALKPALDEAKDEAKSMAQETASTCVPRPGTVARVREQRRVLPRPSGTRPAVPPRG